MPRGSRAPAGDTPVARGRLRKQTSTPSSTKASSFQQGSSPYTPVDLTGSPTSSQPKKRKIIDCSAPPSLSQASQQPPSKKKQKKEPTEEKRCRRFRHHPPQSFNDVYHRAVTQRFFVLDRQRTGTKECPGEKVELTGSTGNIYTVEIGLRPTCDCPYCKNGNQCKHTIFVMKKVLNAPYQHVYQLALLSTELREIFASAPPIDPPPAEAAADDDGNGKRKPIEGDCPICFSELGETKEAVVWCRATCGSNMHQECFETWARTKGGSGDVTCPMCRSVWEGDAGVGGTQGGKVERSRGTVSEGYVNVADQLGISQVRDTSTYSEWFGRSREYGGGYGGRGYGGGSYGGGRRGGRGGWRRW